TATWATGRIALRTLTSRKHCSAANRVEHFEHGQMSAKSSEVRNELVEALKLDLVGPWLGHAFAHELLPENPTRWYLTGYLVPEDAPVQHRSDAEAKDEVDAGGEGGGTDDAM